MGVYGMRACGMACSALQLKSSSSGSKYVLVHELIILHVLCSELAAFLLSATIP